MILLLAAICWGRTTPPEPPERSGADSATSSRLRVGLDVGVEMSTSDPFLHHYAGRLGASIAPAPWVELGVAGIVPTTVLLGPDSNLSPLGRHFTEDYMNGVTIGVSTMDWQVEAVLRIRAFSHAVGPWTLSTGGLAGAALTHTVDDPETLQVNDSDPAFLATADEVHPGPVAGVYWDATRRHWGIRVRAEWVSYVEAVNSDVLLTSNNAMLGGEVLLWF